MKYIFTQHLYLNTMDTESYKMRRVVIFEPKFELASLYAKYLQLHDLQVQICSPSGDLKATVDVFQPHLLIYNVGGGFDTLKLLKRLNPGLMLITVADDTGDDELDMLMRLGVSGHINRKLSRPRDLAELAAQVLIGLNNI